MGTLVEFASRLENSGAALIIIVLILILGLVRVVNSDDAPIEWWHFIASRATDGKQYADTSKLGVLVGIISSTGIVGIIAWEGNLTKDYGPWIFGFWLLFIGGSEAFSKWFRSFLDRRYSAARHAPEGDKDGGTPSAGGQ